MLATTILVPGFLDREDFLEPLARYLRGRGLSAHCVTPQPTSGELPIEQLATRLDVWLHKNLPVEQPINLVGFSMGGLICRTYVQQLDGRQRVKRLITLATPHHGTYTGYLFRRPATIQMRPHSAFLSDLNRNLSALAALDFTSIWTPLDLTIVPATSSRMPVGESVMIIVPLHPHFPFDRRVMKAVAVRLAR